MARTHQTGGKAPLRPGEGGSHIRRRIVAWLLVVSAAGATAEAQLVTSPTSVLKKMSLQELQELEVTSVSKRPEKLTEVASAIQVLTGEDIRRSAATSIPEALRLAPNLQVAQVNASQWAISARGFNNVLANKLLVMIDGRTVYTPLYAGVFWDVQDTLMADIDRIEIVSGPGGTVWGANAVNGVINITTKVAKETQGWRTEAGGGGELRGFGSLRYGGQLAPDLHFRVYGKAFDRDSTRLLNGADAHDNWRMAQGGFRVDWDRSSEDLLTLQGDLYDGKPDPDGNSATTATGGNVLGRWKHTLSDDSGFQLQVYFDRTSRDFGNGFAERVGTYDLDWQHRFKAGQRHEVVWGLNLRVIDDNEQNLPLFGFMPADRTLRRHSVFAQDTIALIDDRLRLTLGSKFEHNTYTGSETQPSVRLAWTPSREQTVWAAVSRAVRVPSRIDRDFYLSAAPTIPIFAGGPDFDSEKLTACELGWRVQPAEKISLSLAAFDHRYDDLRSAEPGPPPLNLPIVIANGVRGETYGVELSAIFQATDRWTLRGGCTFMKKDLSLKPGSADLNQASAESDDPEQQFLVQSSMDLPHGLRFDTVLRHVAALPQPRVPAHTDIDVRLAWTASEQVLLEVVGQNLLDARHPEFVPSSPSAREIERSFFGKATWQF